MRICLIGYGSRGDVGPMLALGRGLRDAGHEVAVAAAGDFTPVITAAGLDPEPFDIDVHEASQTDLGRRWLEGSSVGLREEGRLMSEVARQSAPVVADTLVRIADHYEGVVSGLLTLDPMLSVAAARGQRHATVALAPSPSHPTRVGGATMFLKPDAVSVLNLIGGNLADLGGHRALRPPAK